MFINRKESFSYSRKMVSKQRKSFLSGGEAIFQTSRKDQPDESKKLYRDTSDHIDGSMSTTSISMTFVPVGPVMTSSPVF